MPEKFTILNLKKLKAASGIYAIIGPRGRRYVGQGENVVSRLVDHLNRLISNRHWNKFLQRTWNKYGEDVFWFDVVQKTKCDEKVMERAEQKWMDYYREHDGLYNARPAATSMLGYKHPPTSTAGRYLRSPETKLKLSLSKKNIPRSKKAIKATKRTFAIRKEQGLPVGRPKGTLASEATKRAQSLRQRGSSHKSKTLEKMSNWRKDFYKNPANVLASSEINKRGWETRRRNQLKP